MYPTSEYPSVHFLFLPPGMLLLLFFFPVCVHCIIGNKLQTFILGIQHLHVFILKKCSLFPIISSCTGLAVCRLFVLLRDREHCRTPQKHSLKTLQQHFKRRGDRNGASNCRFQVSRVTGFNPIVGTDRISYSLP